MSLRTIFMGTPDFAVPTLSALLGHGHEIVACYSRAPAPAGRGMALRLSPVQQAAQRFGIPALTPSTLRTPEALDEFRSRQADVAIVVAYGMLLPKDILNVPPLGCLNLHASLLPRWRGAAPIQRAIMAGDSETGVAVMKMAEGLDTGPVGMVERLVITPELNSGEAHEILARLGADLMVRALAALGRGGLSFREQSTEGVTYARKISNDECKIDWSASVQTIHDHIRGLAPFPGAYTMIDLGKGAERVKILRATRTEGVGVPGQILDDALTIACGNGALRLLDLQRAGAKALPADLFLRGVSLPAGQRIG
ncbi:MAG: methionyl-tRNA formyltransferase [Hyphomicrobiales bacterium]